MRMRCDFFVAFFRIFAKCEKSHNAKNRRMRNCEKCDFCSRSAVLKNPVLSHAQNGVLDPEHAPWRTELTHFFYYFRAENTAG